MNNFNGFDDWEATAEYLKENDYTPDCLRTLTDTELLTIVEHWAEEQTTYYGASMVISEEQLSQRFDSEVLPYILKMHGQPGEQFTDTDMVNQAFNDWSNSLCRDGDLHPEQYDKYCYVGEYS